MIQFTKLSSALKKCSYISWIKKNNHDYILSDYFILKTNKDIKGGALTKLIKELGTIPGENQGIQIRSGHKKEMTEDEMKNMLDLLKQKNTKQIYFTNLLHQVEKGLFSIFENEKNYIFLNKLYVDLVDMYQENVEIYGSNSVSPVYFKKGNEELMILPIRMDKNPIYLKGESE